MKNEKLKTKAVALAICIVFLMAMTGITIATLAMATDVDPTLTQSVKEIPYLNSKVQSDVLIVTNTAHAGYGYDVFTSVANGLGKTVTVTTDRPITPSMLLGREILMVEEPLSTLTTSEITAILDFVGLGGGLILTADDYAAEINPLSTNFGITFSTVGTSGNFWFSATHPVVNSPYAITFLETSPDYEFDGTLTTTKEVVIKLGTKDVSAVTTYSGGRVVALSEDEVFLDTWGIENPENQEFAENVLRWLQGSCSIERAVYQAGVSDPEGILNPLRELRDDYLKEEYVDRYYDYSPELTMVVTRDPALAYEAARLLVKYSPMVKQEVYGIGMDKLITRGDVQEIVSVTNRLKRGVWKNREDIGTERSREIIKFLDEFKGQVKASEGETFSEALPGSIYCEDEQMLDPDG